MHDPDDGKYLVGHENRLIRWYYYVNSGLNVLNQFRNLFLGVFALYFALKLTNILWMGVMLVPSLIVLGFVGWYSVHRIAKVQEWLGMKFSTFYGIRQFNYQQGIFENLEEIKEILKKKK